MCCTTDRRPAVTVPHIRQRKIDYWSDRPYYPARIIVPNHTTHNRYGTTYNHHNHPAHSVDSSTHHLMVPNCPTRTDPSDLKPCIFWYRHTTHNPVVPHKHRNLNCTPYKTGTVRKHALERTVQHNCRGVERYRLSWSERTDPLTRTTHTISTDGTVR